MRLLLFGFIVICSPYLYAQNIQSSNPKATESIEGLVNEVLHIISGEEGKIRDWNAFRNLFLPSAKLTILNDAESEIPVESITVEEFIEIMQDAYYQQGFLEYETGKDVNEFNGIANVFQSFYAKDSEGEEGSGINSYQLVYFDSRWHIANLVWTNSRDGQSIPDKYLKK
jgi:hypothetical protein